MELTGIIVETLLSCVLIYLMYRLARKVKNGDQKEKDRESMGYFSKRKK